MLTIKIKLTKFTYLGSGYLKQFLIIRYFYNFFYKCIVILFNEPFPVFGAEIQQGYKNSDIAHFRDWSGEL